MIKQHFLTLLLLILLLLIRNAHYMWTPDNTQRNRSGYWHSVKSGANDGDICVHTYCSSRWTLDTFRVIVHVRGAGVVSLTDESLPILHVGLTKKPPARAVQCQRSNIHHTKRTPDAHWLPDLTDSRPSVWCVELLVFRWIVIAL